MDRIYLDHNATTPLRPEAREAMLRAMDVVGNPASVHAEGRGAKALVEAARAQVAALVGCGRNQVIFTSGATEAANAVVSQSYDLIALSWSVHDCFDKSVVPHTERNLKTHLIEADWRDGGQPLIAEWAGRHRTLFALSDACGETGVFDDISTAVETAKELQVTANASRVNAPAHRVEVVGDITQSVGRVIKSQHARPDYLVLSGHKLGGPKGVGALINLTSEDPKPIILGGGQEMGRRSGTENVIGIAGFGAAAEAAQRDVEAGAWNRVAKLRNILEISLADVSPSTIFVGKDALRLPNTSCFITPGWKGETQVMQMDLAGFAISAGSACSSGKVKESRVLRSMGFGDGAACAVRVSLGLETTEDEILRFVAAWGKAFEKYKARA